MSTPRKVANPVEIVRAMLIEGRYGFALHAKLRLDERELTVAEVVQVIRRGVHEVGRDVYRPEFGDWNYAIVGQTLDGRMLRLVVAIKRDRFLVITAIDFGYRRERAGK
jgi:hypothetical protein